MRNEFVSYPAHRQIDRQTVTIAWLRPGGVKTLNENTGNENDGRNEN